MHAELLLYIVMAIVNAVVNAVHHHEEHSLPDYSSILPSFELEHLTDMRGPFMQLLSSCTRFDHHYEMHEMQ